MDIKKYLVDKADKNGDGKVDIGDLNFVIDALHADRHLVALYGFAVGVVFAVGVLSLFGK